jgi:hypothetical protein
MAQRQVAEFKSVTLVYQSNGVATFQLYTDMPGGVLTARLGSGVTLPSTADTRKEITIPLEGIEGKQFYPQVTPGAATQIRIFSGQVELRPIGLYLDGSLSPQGEIWKTQPIAIGA